MQSQTFLGDVEPYQQRRPYTCGAAALKAVSKHWGRDFDELALADLIGVDPTRGSTTDQVATAARRLGYTAWPHEFASTDELRRYTARDVPVIIAVRSFTRPNQGHFVVATEIDEDTVEIMDPNVPGNRRTLSRVELDRRWQFRDRAGVIVMPQGRPRGGLGTAREPRPWVPFALAGLVAAMGTAVVIMYQRR